MSLPPDITYVTLTNLVGQTQTIDQTGFSIHIPPLIQILNGTVTIGLPAAGWTATVFANSRSSNTFILF